MAAILFFRDSPRMRRDYALLDRLASMHGLIPIVIDDEAAESHHGAHTYQSLREAVEDKRWAGWEWIWFDHRGTHTMEEIRPLRAFDNVIYCVGSDMDGFGGIVDPGLRVRLPDDMVLSETFASLVVPVVCGWYYWRK